MSSLNLLHRKEKTVVDVKFVVIVQWCYKNDNDSSECEASHAGNIHTT